MWIITKKGFFFFSNIAKSVSVLYSLYKWSEKYMFINTTLKQIHFLSKMGKILFKNSAKINDPCFMLNASKLTAATFPFIFGVNINKKSSRTALVLSKVIFHLQNHAKILFFLNIFSVLFSFLFYFFTLK